jgi:hypothetical protein
VDETGLETKIMDTFMINENTTTYTIKYFAQLTKEYSKYLPTIQRMIDSFKIISLK